MKRGRKPRGYGQLPVVASNREPWQIAQAAKCGCQGTDDLCACQNEDAPWRYGLAARPENPDWQARALAAEAQVSALQAQVDGLREGVTAADAALAEAEAILGGEYADQHAALFERIQDLRALLSQPPADKAAKGEDPALSQQGGLG